MSLFTPRGLLAAMSVGDRVVTLGVLAGGLGLALLAGAPVVPATRATVLVDREVVATLPLDRDVRKTVQGRRGPVVVEVAGGAVAVVESGCPQRICVAMGAKRRAGEIVACVPNALLVRVEGAADPDTPDAVSR